VADDDFYKGKSLLTEMYKIERTERREAPGAAAAAAAIGGAPASGCEILAADHEEKIGLAVECAFEKFVEKGPRLTELYGGIFCIARAPKFYV
jgi:hypothetical protein